MRLIDADAFKTYMRNALEETRNCYPDGGDWAATITEEFCKDIDAQPTIGPQVHCKDCKWWKKQENSLQGRCALFGMYPTGEWHCGNARRRDDEEVQNNS